MVDHVDFFVILEAAKTFTNEPKPLYVRENWSRFKKYHHKMILHTLETEGVNFEDGDTWAIERFSRNAMYDQVIPKCVPKISSSLSFFLFQVLPLASPRSFPLTDFLPPDDFQENADFETLKTHRRTRSLPPRRPARFGRR
jgi:hypothetical protein